MRIELIKKFLRITSWIMDFLCKEKEIGYAMHVHDKDKLLLFSNIEKSSLEYSLKYMIFNLRKK